MTAYSELREKVEGASGPSRELDARIAEKLFFQFDGSRIALKVSDVGLVRYESPGGWDEVPRLTASIDAALALVERVLPGQGWQLLEEALFLDRMSAKGPVTSDLPRVLILTLLHILEAKDTGHG